MSENQELATAVRNIAADYLAEKKRERRWKMIRNILVAVVIVILSNARKTPSKWNREALAPALSVWWEM